MLTVRLEFSHTPFENSVVDFEMAAYMVPIDDRSESFCLVSEDTNILTQLLNGIRALSFDPSAARAPRRAAPRRAALCRYVADVCNAAHRGTTLGAQAPSRLRAVRGVVITVLVLCTMRCTRRFAFPRCATAG
jgi:hypothetical protein